MRRHWFDAAAPRLIALVLLFAIFPITEAAHQHSLSSLSNGDFWWHLRTGLGILQDHALPRSGLYSQSSAIPWMASSWLYDVAVAAGFRAFDLLIVPLTAIACKLALSVLTFLLAGGLRGRFWTAILLSAATQFILVNLPPLPTYCSALLFAVELLLLMESRRTGDVRPLYWLPLLFLLWANVDAQFVVGIFVLLLSVAASLMEECALHSGAAGSAQPQDTPLKALGAVAAASLFATVITPYGWGLYGVFWARVSSSANIYYPDFQSLRFRSPQDYLLLLLIAAAFLALGMRRSRDGFQIPLLLLCTFAAFHSQRDAWLAALAALAILGDVLPKPGPQQESEEAPLAKLPLAKSPLAKSPLAKSPLAKSKLLLAAGLAVVLLAGAAAIHFPRSRAAMLAKAGKAYPVAASDFIRDHRLPQPLFNSLPWGGFLTWYLPEYPVAIDGRTDLYGDEFNVRYAQVMNAEAHFSTLPALNLAGTLLLEKNSLMGVALATVPGFKVAYSDNVAVVLVREQPRP